MLQALSRLKLHPREDSRNIVLLARADRIFEESLGAIRHDLSVAIARFQDILDHQDLHEIAIARDNFGAYLDAVEHGTPDFLNT